MNRPALHRTASAVLVISAIGLLFASVGILSPSPDLESKVGRHLLAGGLANAALAFVLILVAANAIRRGEAWGLAAYVASLLIYGVPILIVDATHVAPSRLLRTLAPQIAGISVMTAGVVLAALAISSRKKRSGSTKI